MKIVYKVEVTEASGRYSVPVTTTRSFILDRSNGFFVLQKCLLSIENLVSFRVIEAFPAVELSMDSDVRETYIF